MCCVVLCCDGVRWYVLPDSKNYKTLEKEISGRLHSPEAHQRWQAHCGLSSLVTAVTKSVLTEVTDCPALSVVLHCRDYINTYIYSAAP